MSDQMSKAGAVAKAAAGSVGPMLTPEEAASKESASKAVEGEYGGSLLDQLRNLKTRAIGEAKDAHVAVLDAEKRVAEKKNRRRDALRACSEAGLTRDEIGKALGVNESQVGTWIRDLPPKPKSEKKGG
jgi:DNA-directed RNA polymerase specialized sigma24 family protein